MGGDYRKFTVEMQLMNDEYRLWRSGIDGSTCIVESYKDKRSLYFAVSNLLPSASLLSQGNREYRLILMGVDEGEIIHRDFGSFFVDQKGDGSFFKKFTGPTLECYTHWPGWFLQIVLTAALKQSCLGRCLFFRNQKKK